MRNPKIGTQILAHSNVQDLNQFLQSVVYSGVHPIQGNKLLSSVPVPQRISSGSPNLDGILKGGLLPGSITEFAGPTNTGKTLVSLY
jgi:RecA/RadA recombinase